MQTSAPLLLLVAIGLGGCVTNTNQATALAPSIQASAARAPVVRQMVLIRGPSKYVAASGKRTQLAAFQSLNADCSVADYYTVRVVVPPSHGTAGVEKGRYYSNYPQGNQRYACNTSPQGGVAAWYQSAAGYIGPDLVELQLIAPGGQARLVDVHLDVK